MKRYHVRFMAVAAICLASCGMSEFVTGFRDVSTEDEFINAVTSGSKISLKADLDFSHHTNAFPLKSTSSWGLTIHGNDHVIKGISIKKSEGNVGVFDASSLEIENLSFKDVNVEVAGEYEGVGILAGGSAKSGVGCKLTNITVSGSVTAEYCSYVGGFVGVSNAAKIRNCVSDVTVKGYSKVGGIFGHLKEITDYEEILDCENKGTVSGGYSVGGLFGWASSAGFTNKVFYDKEIRNLKNSGPVSASDRNGGGIVGYASTYYTNRPGWMRLTFKNCSNSGDVTVNGKNAGGILGKSVDVVKMFDGCVNESEAKVSGREYVGGIAGYSGGFKNCKNHGTVASTLPVIEDGNAMAMLGGIAGYGTGFANCSNDGAVTAEQGGWKVGGIAGHLYYQEGDKIIGNVNEGVVTSRLSGVDGSGSTDSEVLDFVGGVFGYAYGKEPSSSLEDTSATILRCTNKGSIVVKGQTSYSVGGIVGSTSCGSFGGRRNYLYLDNCRNEGPINDPDSRSIHVGGILGYGVDSSYVVSCTNEATIKGYTHVGGIVGRGNIVSGCENTGNVRSTVIASTSDVCTGGIAGLAANVTASVNRGKVEGDSATGGIVGRLELRPDASCSGNVNYGIVIGTGKGVGGVAGKVHCRKISGTEDSTCTFSNNKNYGSVKGPYCGGLIGYQTSDLYDRAVLGMLGYSVNRLIVEDNSNEGGVNGEQYAAGVLAYGEYISNVFNIRTTNTNTGAISGTSLVASGEIVGYMA